MPDLVSPQNSSTVLGSVTVFRGDELSESACTSIARIPIWTDGWTERKAIYRNSLLFTIHPKIEWCILELSNGKEEKDEKQLNSFKAPGQKKAYQLDLASSTRNKGRFTFSKTPVGRDYMGTKNEWKRIIYGSILHTSCKNMQELTVNMLIVDDKKLDENGNLQDDPGFQKYWKTGPEHAKATATIMRLLQPTEIPKENVSIQFHAAVPNKIIAKGTIAWNPELDGNEHGIDIVIPVSCLKGNKYPLGLYQTVIYIGTILETELHEQTRPVSSLWEWFKWETLAQDMLVNRLSQKAKELASATNSMKNLAKIMAVEPLPSNEPENLLDTEALYENPFVKILQADNKGILLAHPYLVKRALDRIQKMWVQLVTASGLRVLPVFSQPDDKLSKFHIQIDNKFVGTKVFCAPDLEFYEQNIFKPYQGRYIAFSNSMRHWRDVQIWQNRKEGNFTENKGVLAVPRSLLTSLGKNIDGDFIQLSPAHNFPALVQEIETFDAPPAARKFPKAPLKGNLRQMAIRSMNDHIGTVAKLLARARAYRQENTLILIQKGSSQVQVRIVEFLSQELQIAIDSKNNNTAGLATVKDYLDMKRDAEGRPTSPAYQAPWIADLKNNDCFRYRPCQVGDATDTVSRIVKLVNDQWIPSSLQWEDTSPKTYVKALFSKVPYSKSQLAQARELLVQYRTQILEALNKKSLTGDDTDVKQIARYYRQKSDELPGDRMSWAAAMWFACHEAKTGDSGLVFNMYSNEIIERLKVEGEKPPADKVVISGVQLGVWGSTSGHRWMDEEVWVQFIEVERGGKTVTGATMLYPGSKSVKGWHYLGDVDEADVDKVTLYKTFKYRIWTNIPTPRDSTAWESDAKTSSVTLFAPKVTDLEKVAKFLGMVVVGGVLALAVAAVGVGIGAAAVATGVGLVAIAGLTMTELLVSGAIVGVIAAVAVPMLLRAIGNAQVRIAVAEIMLQIKGRRYDAMDEELPRSLCVREVDGKVHVARSNGLDCYSSDIQWITLSADVKLDAKNTTLPSTVNIAGNGGNTYRFSFADTAGGLGGSYGQLGRVTVTHPWASFRGCVFLSHVDGTYRDAYGKECIKK